jgi:hypothetical protein
VPPSGAGQRARAPRPLSNPEEGPMKKKPLSGKSLAQLENLEHKAEKRGDKKVHDSINRAESRKLKMKVQGR